MRRLHGLNVDERPGRRAARQDQLGLGSTAEPRPPRIIGVCAASVRDELLEAFGAAYRLAVDALRCIYAMAPKAKRARAAWNDGPARRFFGPWSPERAEDVIWVYSRVVRRFHEGFDTRRGTRRIVLRCYREDEDEDSCDDGVLANARISGTIRFCPRVFEQSEVPLSVIILHEMMHHGFGVSDRRHPICSGSRHRCYRGDAERLVSAGLYDVALGNIDNYVGFAEAVGRALLLVWRRDPTCRAASRPPECRCRQCSAVDRCRRRLHRARACAIRERTSDTWLNHSDDYGRGDENEDCKDPTDREPRTQTRRVDRERDYDAAPPSIPGIDDEPPEEALDDEPGTTAEERAREKQREWEQHEEHQPVGEPRGGGTAGEQPSGTPKPAYQPAPRRKTGKPLTSGLTIEVLHPDGDAALPDGCRRRIVGAVHLAYLWARCAERAMEVVWSDKSKRGSRWLHHLQGDATIGPFAYWMGTSPRSSLEIGKVRHRIGRIRGYLGTDCRIRVFPCRGQTAPGMPGGFEGYCLEEEAEQQPAYTVAPWIYICPTFFDNDIERNAMLMIHELVHRYVQPRAALLAAFGAAFFGIIGGYIMLGHPIVGGERVTGENNPPLARELARRRPWAARRSPANYAFLFRDIARNSQNYLGDYGCYPAAGDIDYGACGLTSFRCD